MTSFVKISNNFHTNLGNLEHLDRVQRVLDVRNLHLQAPLLLDYAGLHDLVLGPQVLELFDHLRRALVRILLHVLVHIFLRDGESVTRLVAVRGYRSSGSSPIRET